ncbi:MAG: adenylate/guanylate cyclase domain-containing protein [Anaerolineae bacterium]
MSVNLNQQVIKLKQALAEIRANREHFSETAFSQIVMLMLERLRDVQTVTPFDEPRNDEIRLVTVMFIDVKDSTELVQQLDASDWKMIIDTAHEQIAEIVNQWDGQIGQYLGDGVLCFFGARRSRGDEAPHAVSCALQIQSMLEDYATNLRDLHGIDFGLRIGISTGRVVVGMIGSQTIKQELLALGPATNLAARLQGIAPVGGVLVDSTTYNRIRRDYIIQAQAPVTLRGFDRPIHNYQVLGRRTQLATQFAETKIAGIDLPLVGRDEDLALISYICDRSLHNQACHVLTITGDVGIGKSRLLQEAIHLTEGHFAHIIMSSQYEARSKSQNLLWDFLTTQCHLTDDMSEILKQQQVEAYISSMWQYDDASKVAHAIMHLAGLNVDAPDDNPTEWVLRWFEEVAHHEPVVIIVDSLQWADEQSVRLLEQLAYRLQDESVVILVATRPEYEMIYPTYMQNYPRHTVLKLEALTAEATLNIIQTVFDHVDKIPPMLATSINKRVEGNPLFVNEYLGMLFDNNVFKPKPDGGWRFNIIMLDVALNTLPNGLLSILQARLDDLPDQSRQLIQAAAISGQQFWVDAINTLLGIDNAAEMIQYLITRGMVVADSDSIFEGEQQYHFRHSLYRDVAYEMIPRIKRETYHHQMASWLLQRISGQSDQYPLLADQFTNSGQHLGALHTYLEAVEVKINKRMEQSALELIDQALGLASKVDREEALAVGAKLWAYRGEALVVLERYEEASAASQSSQMLLNELPKEQLVASRITAERILGLAYLSLGRYTDAYDALTNAYNLLPLNALDQISSVLRALGKLYYYQGRLEESVAYYRRALDTAHKTQDLNLIALTLDHLGNVEVERGRFAVALEHCEEALQIHRALASVPEQARELFHIGIVHLTTMNFGKAYEYFADSEYLNSIQNYSNPLVQGYQAFSLIMLGRHTQGKALLIDAMNNVPRDIDTQHRLQSLNLASMVVLGDYVQVRDQGMALIQQKTLNPILKARAQRWLGLASYQLGTQDALDHLRQALEGEQTFGGRDVWLCHLSLAQCLEDPEEKAEQYHHASRLVREIAVTLKPYPDIQQDFWASHLVQLVLNYADADQSILG